MRESIVLRNSLLTLLLFVSASVTAAQTTTFTYQGKLQEGGVPVNGSRDMQFSLFDTANLGTGTQHGSTVTRPAVQVTGGIFTVQLDFGACGDCFDGANRFLEIAVKLTTSATYTTLDPRQPMTSTPYAIRSLNATTANGLSTACVNCVTSSQILNISGSQISGQIPVASVPPGSTNYIQNTTVQQTPANFNVAGNGTLAGTLSAGTVNATQYNINGNRVLSIPGVDNTFVGLSTGAANSSGISNSFFGRSAGINNDDGNFNSFFGVGAGFSNVSGSENSSFGFQSGNTFASGNDNSFFGYRAGLSSTGSNQTLIGANANVGTPGLVNATAIGANARVDQGNTLVLGSIAGINGATASTSVGIGTPTPGTKLDIVTDGVLDTLRLRNTNPTNPRSFRIGPGVGSPFVFGIYDDNANATRLSIDDAGNVGIGMIGASSRLHVNGNVTVNGVITTGLGSPGDISNALCLNNSNQIGLCSQIPQPKAPSGSGVDRQQQQIRSQQAELKRLQQQLVDLTANLAAFKRLVCINHPTEDLCK